MTRPSPVLTIENLTLGLPRLSDRRHAVENVSLSIMPGEMLCVVGESGSGKSLTALAAIGLLPDGIEVLSGAIRLGATDLLVPHRSEVVRGARAGHRDGLPGTHDIPQPGDARRRSDRRDVPGPWPPRAVAERERRAIELLSEVHLPHPERIARAYPHELSGGQRQRVMIAMAMALEPKLLIADEPTTALDVTTQAQVLRLIDNLRRRKGTAVLFITHDFGVVAEVGGPGSGDAAGLLVEEGPVDEVLHHPRHPYTRRLLAAVPSLTPPAAKPVSEEPVALRVEGLTKVYGGAGLVPEEPPGAGRGRGLVRDPARRDPGSRRRVGVGEIDGRAVRAAPGRAGRGPHRDRRHSVQRDVPARAAPATAAHPDGFSGPLRIPQPPPHRWGRSWPKGRSSGARTRPRWRGPAGSSGRSDCPRQRPSAIRTNSRAASASASASPGRSPCGRTCSWPTRRCRPSTSRSRPTSWP